MARTLFFGEMKHVESFVYLTSAALLSSAYRRLVSTEFGKFWLTERYQAMAKKMN
jgi:hypothetical protein